MALTFYYASGSPYAWRVWLALEHKGIPYGMKTLSFDAGDLNKPEFLKLNPRHRVPVIVDDGFVLYESAAIVEYLEDREPGEPRLFSERLPLRAHARVEDASRPRQLCAQAFEQRLRTLAAQVQSLSRAAQSVERGGGFLAPPGSVRKFLFRASPLLEERVEPLVGVPTGERRGGAPALAVFESFTQIGQIQLCHSRTKRCQVAE